jgi:predicted nicotinamide N-methyase
VPLCPELRAHYASSLVAVWEAAEALAGETLPAPFWAYPWPGGCAVARVLLDRPERVASGRVLDFGAGGGVSCLAALRAGAATVTANDVDPWALQVAKLAAAAQGFVLETLAADLCQAPELVDDYDVVLCSDMAYERSQAPLQRRVLERACRNGATVLVSDAGRSYFDPGGMELLAAFQVDVPHDLEGVTTRTARVFEAGGF